MPSWGLPALSWLVSFYFLAGFVANVGFPPSRSIFAGDAMDVALWLFFLFLPFFRKVKLGGWLELEREIAEAKAQAARAEEELKEFKSEVRNTIQVLSTNVNTIGGMSNQVTVNLPGQAELDAARAVIDEKASASSKIKGDAVEQEITLQGEEDRTLALAKTRIEIERLLRLHVGKSTKVDDAVNAKFLSLNKLVDLFVQQKPKYSWMRDPFRAVFAVCNAAMHAQRVPTHQANEALKLGAEMIAVLQDIDPRVS